MTKIILYTTGIIEKFFYCSRGHEFVKSNLRYPVSAIIQPVRRNDPTTLLLGWDEMCGQRFKPLIILSCESFAKCQLFAKCRNGQTHNFKIARLVP